MRPRNGTILALLMAILFYFVPPAADAAEVRILPATVAATIGEVISLSIQVDSAADLAGFQFDFTFVPAALEVKKVTIAPAFDHLVKGTFDNVLGRGLVAAYSVSSTPVSGTNLILATVEFTVKGGGSAVVNFANQLLGAIGGDEIPSTRGTPDGTTVISKASATVILTGLTQTYDGTAKTVTATTTPPDLPVNVTYDGSTAVPVNVGRYAVVATVNHADYSGSAGGTLLISAPSPFRIVGSPTQYYPTLSAAYLDAKDNNVIEIKTGTVVEDLIADQSSTVYLKGGFDDVFSPSPSGYTAIQGKISLRAGKVVMDGIRVKALPPVPDTTPPLVALSVVPPLTALTVQVNFTATDQAGVTGYKLSESSSVPPANDPGWLGAAPASYTFGNFGDKTLYAYAKDAAGKIGSAVATFGVYATSQVLTVTTSGTGSGNVHSSLPGIACTSSTTDGCAASFSYTPQGVDLVAAASTGSIFGGWSGDCNGFGTCHVIVSNPRNVTATFTSAPYVRIASISYATLQDAYNKAKSGDEIMLQGGILAGQLSSLIANRDVSIVITGGYDANYIGVNTETVIQGQLILQAGTVKVKNVRLRP